MTDHSVEVPKKVLSPAAQAVDHAIAARIYLLGEIAPSKQVAAAALRALAVLLVGPHPVLCPRNSYMDGVRDAKQDVRAAILAIATELENAR